MLAILDRSREFLAPITYAWLYQLRMRCLVVALVTFGESIGDVDAEDDSHHADVSGHIIDISKHDHDSNDDGQCDRLHDSNYGGAHDVTHVFLNLSQFTQLMLFCCAFRPRAIQVPHA